ncbi:MAG: NUDIX domain-containing protein [Campylobacterota bacterium]|nr:NUDIX domain-containing protein [Campylobacterota bacterium]
MKIKAYGICLYKIDKFSTKLLLCKSITSNERWGFLKGGEEEGETKIQTALREFEEESNIKVSPVYLEKYFEQINTEKDIGIYLVNYDKINNIEKYFIDDKLLSSNLSWENSSVKFFDIKSLPLIKKKQQKIMLEIVQYFKKGS